MWLSGLWRSLLYSSSVFSCHLFLISSPSVRSIPFLTYIEPHICMKCSLGISNFLKEISSLSHSIVFLYFFALITEEESLLFFGTLHSNGYIFPFLLCLLLFFFSYLFVRPPQTTILCFCISFSWGWSQYLPPIQCQKSLSIFLQALCLSDLIPWIYLSLPLYNCKGLDLCHT